MPPTTKAMLRCLILGAAGGVAGLVLFAAPAYADDDTQHPGGLLGSVVEVVDQVIPDVEPTKAPDPEPTKDPEPPAETEPADEPGHGTDGHDEQAAADEPAPVITVPAIEIPVDLPPVVIDLPPVVVDLPPLVVDVPPVVVVTPPVVVPTPTPTPQPTTPAPTTDTTTPAPTTTPQTPAVVPVAPLDELPVVIGPTAGTGTLLPGLMREPGAAEHTDTDATTGTRLCDGRDDQPQRTPGGDGKQDRRTADQPTNSGTPPAKPCPTPTGPGDTATGMSAALAHTTNGADQPPGDTTATLAWPALDRLHHVRARGDLPASRTTHLEPGPA
ncbi:hypothetical protein OG423_13980 [Micromonospora zamorensis]|uniref:hypothetical protein n=1 Tax=Micromonospora zamorensis TaxID=709883 RepID=UPI00352B509C|nr:hypothetical protein OG423_13980 [Micromonospora zamorensis]